MYGGNGSGIERRTLMSTPRATQSRLTRRKEHLRTNGACSQRRTNKGVSAWCPRMTASGFQRRKQRFKMLPERCTRHALKRVLQESRPERICRFRLTPRRTGKLICTICFTFSICEWTFVPKKKFENTLC